MGTVLANDIHRFDKLAAKYPTKGARKGTGTLTFAGTHWPARNAVTVGGAVAATNFKAQTSNRLMYNDVETAFREARAMIVEAYAVATAAALGERGAAVTMTRWFGARQVNSNPPNPNHRDWWVGAQRILGVIESFITSSINLYYRGDDSLLGKTSDYPNDSSLITAQDLSGFAESEAGATDKIIGLCKLFFRKQKVGRAMMKLSGFDSAGGTLIHELSHNLCKTEDHEAMGGGDCYGTADCLALAVGLPRRAWYNADNIEYFCEDVYYKLGGAVVAPGAEPGKLGAARKALWSN